MAEGRRRRVSGWVLAGLVVAALGASAGDAGAEGSDADRYFREGQELMAQQKYADACKKFESSLKLDTQLGTQLNLAFCYEKIGATWYAWVEYKEAELRAIAQARKDRADFAHGRQRELEKGLARAVIKVSMPAPDVVMVEDRAIPDAHKGAPFAVESGVRKLTFKRSGKKPVEREVNVPKQGQPYVIEAPAAYEDEDLPPPPPPPKVEAPPPPPPPPESGGSRFLAYGALGLGAVGVGLGAAAGVLALSAKSDVEAQCNTPNKKCTTAEGNAALSRGQSMATISTVSFIAGGALVASGVALFFILPSGKKAAIAPAFTPGGASLSAAAAF